MSATTAYLLYFVFALGGAAVYFLLPRGDRSKAIVGAVLGIAAVVALVAVLALGAVSPERASMYFHLFAVIAIAAAARVITHPKPVYSAIYFVLVVVAVAALLVLQQAQFVAIALIIIYAGAILVTYLFVIMLASQSGSPVYDRRAREPFLAVLAGFVLMAAVAGRAGDLPDGARATAPVKLAGEAQTPSLPESNTLAIGAAVMTRYVVVLEIAGMLLLIAMVGAIGLSRKRVPPDGHREPRAPIGEVGKKVVPY